MEKIIVKTWGDVIRNLPSWVHYSILQVEYAKETAGLVICVPEIKPALEDFPDVKTEYRFTKENLMRFLNTKAGSQSNFVTQLNGTWYHILKPYIWYKGERRYVTENTLEAANLWLEMHCCNKAGTINTSRMNDACAYLAEHLFRDRS